MVETFKRLKTGIKGLDELMEGGFPTGSTILVSGGTGSAKTTLCMQYLYYGAKNDEPSVYISLEETPERMMLNFKKTFNWDLNELIKKKKLFMTRAELYDFEKLKILIEDVVERFKATRLVIDPTTVLGLFFEKDLQIRRSMLELDRMLKKLGCTTLMTSEVPEGQTGISTFGIEEFASDGIIILYYTREGNVFTRALTVRKMRATKHDSGIHPIEITKQGIVVYPTEQVFG